MSMNIDLLDDLGRIFDWQPDPAQYFATPATELVRKGLSRGLETGSGVLVLTGTAGAGKTLLLQIVLQAAPDRWSHLAQLNYTSMSGAEILRSMAYAFGMPAGSQSDDIAPLAWTETQLRRWAARGEASLLVVDEAQNLPLDALQPLLALSRLQMNDRPLLRMIFVGRPPLLELLAAPALRAWAGAIGQQFSLPAFQARESSAYIAKCLARLAVLGRPRLSEPVVAEIHARTQGRPGQINLLCKQLLQTAILLEDGAPINVPAVANQADELGFKAEAAASDAAPREPTPVKPDAAVVVGARPRKWRALPALAMLIPAVAIAIFLLYPESPQRRTEASAVAVSPPAPMAAPMAAPEPVRPVAESESANQAEAEKGLTVRPPPLPAQPPTRLAANTLLPATRPSKTETPNCAHLLTQLSLGEPLTARQQHALESKCR